MEATVSDFLTSVMKALPAFRTRLQYGIGLLAILAFVFVQTTASSPIIPQIFVFAVVPLLIAMQLIRGLPHVQQFVIILLITLMSLAFLGTGVVLAQDRGPQLFTEYRDNVYPKEDALNTRYLKDQEAAIKKVKTYTDYRALVLGIAKDDKSEGLSSDLEAIVNFYENYVDCRSKWQCLGSKQLDSHVVDFWYTYRPIIEERRVALWGPDFAKGVQTYAESIRHPMYLSAVKIDPSTGRTELISTKPQFAPIKASL
jgi:hypothetical protein